MVDKSESMRLVPPRSVSTKLDMAVRLAAILGYSALRRNQQVNFYAYDDQFIPMERAMGAVNEIGLGMKFYQQMVELPSKKKTSFLTAAEKLIQVDKHKGVVIIFTDMYDDSFLPGLSLLHQAGYLPRVERLYSDHERGVGLFGDVTISDAETGLSWDITITEGQLKYFQRKFRETTERTKKWCARFAARYQNVYCDQPATQACLQAMGLKD